MELRQEAGPSLLMVMAGEGQRQLSLVLRYQHGLRWLHRPGMSAWSLAETWASVFNTDPGCDRTTDAVMVPGSSTSPDVTIASAGSAGHSD